MKSTETIFLIAVVAVSTVAVGLLFVSPAPGQASDAADVDATYVQEPPAVPEEPGTATVDGEQFQSVTAAAEHAEPGDTVVLEGTFEEQVLIPTDNVTVTASDAGAVIDGQGEGHVVNVTGENVVVTDLWVRNSGYDSGNQDAALFLDGDGAVLRNLHLTDVLWGVWVHAAHDVRIEDSYVHGREEITPMVERGNGIHLWEAEDAAIENVTITGVRDGIYYSFASGVVTRNSTMANSRYGVHYMYSNDNRMVDNLAIDNDVGYALMVSKHLEIVRNEAINNRGASGHGILVKEIDESSIRGNVVVDNHRGIRLFNSNDNELLSNLAVNNEIGVESTGGSEDQRVVGNSFIGNDRPAVTETTVLKRWNGTDRGNYWSSARTVDATGDGLSDVRYRPQGIVEHVTNEHPQAEVFADSPAFDAVRLAENSFPIIESPGIVDERPLVEPPHDNWREYAEESD